MRVRHLLPIVVLTAATACGGDDGAAVDTGEGTTLAEWAEQVGALCATHEAREDLDREPTDAADTIALYREYAQAFDDLIADVRAVPVPASDAEDIEAWLASGDEQLVAVQDGLAAVEALDADATLEEVEAALAPMGERYGEAYGSTQHLEEGLLLADTACAE